MKKLNFKKGFTLIELLVVIAIIGILASVVLASLNNARSKGSDAAIKANLSGIRANAELQYDTSGGCYSTSTDCTTVPDMNPVSCDTSTLDAEAIFSLPSIAQQIDAAASAGGGFTSCSTTLNGTAWGAVVQLKSNSSQAWCVDSSGKSKLVSDSAAYTQASLNAELDATSSLCAE